MPEYRTFFEKLARDRNITVDEMRAIISARIEAGINDPDPTRRAQWEKIPHAGDTPTPEEWLSYVDGKLDYPTCSAGTPTSKNKQRGRSLFLASFPLFVSCLE